MISFTKDSFSIFLLPSGQQIKYNHITYKYNHETYELYKYV